jgi:hypothetical protein
MHGMLPCTLVALLCVVERNIAYMPTSLYSLHFETPLMKTRVQNIKVLIPTNFSYKIRDLKNNKLINKGYTAKWF